MQLAPFLGAIQVFDEANFYRACYHINGKSFHSLQQYEAMPLSKFQLLVSIHLEAVENERKAWER
jgi:hypothetical protein